MMWCLSTGRTLFEVAFMTVVMNLLVAYRAKGSMINREVTVMTLIHGVCEMMGVLQSCIFNITYRLSLR